MQNSWKSAQLNQVHQWNPAVIVYILISIEMYHYNPNIAYNNNKLSQAVINITF